VTINFDFENFNLKNLFNPPSNLKNIALKKDYLQTKRKNKKGTYGNKLMEIQRMSENNK
jgi:hypothetical protein